MSFDHLPFHYTRSFLRLLSLMTRYLQYPSHFFTETRRQKLTYKVAVPRTFIATKQGHMRYAKYLSNPLWIHLSLYLPIDSILILPLVTPYPFQLFHVTILSLASPNLAISMHSLSQLHIAFKLRHRAH